MSTLLAAPLILALATAVFVAIAPLTRHRRVADIPTAAAAPHRTVAIGTVRSIDDPITVEVESVSGRRFVGRLHQDAGAAGLAPGVLLLVSFDPTARERLSLADDMSAVRAVFDQMLLDKGLVTDGQIDLLRHGIRTRAVVTAMRATGGGQEDHREVELDLMVRTPDGGQFPARETVLIPASSLAKVAPGCVVDACYREDHGAVAVNVPPT